MELILSKTLYVLPLPPPIGDTPTEGLRKAVIVDTETDGLEDDSKIIEIGLREVWFEPETYIIRGFGRGFNHFEDCGHPLSEEVKAVTRIDDEMIAGQFIPDAEVDAIMAGCTLMIAHNAAFDRPRFDRRFPQHAAQWWACSSEELTWKAWGAPSKALLALAWFMGFDFEPHRAMSDVNALGALLAMPAPDSVYTLFQCLISSARTPTAHVEARGAPFDMKDKLKARGYKWDITNRWWARDVPEDQEPVEVAWLIRSMSGSPKSHYLTARDRYMGA